MTKISKKRKFSEVLEKTETNSESPSKQHVGKTKWTNKQRVLVFSSREINYRDRHLMEDIKKLMPHHRPESKMERAKTLSIINEMCEMKNCNKALLFEGRRKRDLYVWMSNVPNGPSVKFAVENVHTMAELKLTGNCLRGSRPLLSFDPKFVEQPQYMLLKELFTQTFGVPQYHPKSQPFFDHVYTFTVLDNRIWFRNFQILSEDGALAEIGPRFVLNPVKIFSGSFGGTTLWENAEYISPAKYRRHLLLSAKHKAYIGKKQQKEHAESTKPDTSYKLNPLDDIFKVKHINENELKELLNEEETTVEKSKPIRRKKVPIRKTTTQKPKKIQKTKPKKVFKRKNLK